VIAADARLARTGPDMPLSWPTSALFVAGASVSRARFWSADPAGERGVLLGTAFNRKGQRHDEPRFE